MEQLIDPKVLADGKLLLHLKHEFITNQNESTLLSVLHCLRDSTVIVPLHAQLSEEDRKRIANAPKGEEFTLDHDVMIEPDILVNGNLKYLPIFSNQKQIPREYGEQFTLAALTVPECVNMLREFREADGMVLDAFTEAMVIDAQNAEIMVKFKSRLKLQPSAE